MQFFYCVVLINIFRALIISYYTDREGANGRRVFTQFNARNEAIL
jgi:hypothetical protein